MERTAYRVLSSHICRPTSIAVDQAQMPMIISASPAAYASTTEGMSGEQKHQWKPLHTPMNIATYISFVMLPSGFV